MSDQSKPGLYCQLVEEEVQFTLVELSAACHADPGQVAALVEEGILAPQGEDRPHWRFEGNTLERARLALRLARDLELNPSGTAMVLDLLDEIRALRARLHRAGLS